MGYFPRCWKQLSFWDKVVWLATRGTLAGVEYTDNGLKIVYGPNGDGNIASTEFVKLHERELRARMEREKASS